MNKPVRYFTSRRNPLTWLSVLSSAATVVLLILSLCFSAPGRITPAQLWLQKILPMAVALYFGLMVALRGHKSFYRCTTAVFWGCVYFGQVAFSQYTAQAGYPLFMYLRYVVVCWILYFVFYLAFRLTVTGHFKHPLAFQLISLVPVVILTCDLIHVHPAELPLLLDKLANILLTLSLALAALAMRPFLDGKYHKTWGDRSDGRRLRSLDGISVVGNYFMPNRNGASNCIHDTIEITNIERYIHRKRAEGMENFGFTHVFLAAYVRCIAKYPACNRFLSGQRVYQRDEDIQFIMAIKKEMSTESPDTMVKIHLERTDTAKEVYEKFNKVFLEVRGTPLDSSFDQVAGLLASVPGLLLKFVVWVLKVADYFGKIPKFLLEVSPFHGSVIFTSMASLGIPPVVHHLYDFGNLPAFIAFGKKYRKVELDANGNPVTRRYMDYAVNTDERICDGFYYATVLKYLQKVLRNPEILDTPITNVVTDID